MERIANEKIKFPPDFNAATSIFAKSFQKPVMFSSQSRYDRFDTSAYLVFIAPPRTAFGKMRDFDAR